VLWRCGTAYPHAQAVAQAGVEAVSQVLRAVPAAHFGRPTAKRLVAAAQASSSSGRALSGRASSLRILCDQLEHCIGYLAHPFEKWITCRCKYARSDLLSPQDMPFKQRKKFDGEAELSSPRHLLQKHAMIRAKPGEDCLVPLPAISQRVFQASRSSSVVVV